MMQFRTLSKRVLFLVATLSIFIIFYFLPTGSIKNIVETDSPKIEQKSFRSPVSIKIPKINVSASITDVGIDGLGAMEVPKGPDDVAWLDLSARPGEIGSSVMAGHSGYKDNIPAVFDDLYLLEIGDKIYIEDEKGVTTTFVVRKLKRYTSSASVPEVFGSSDRLAHLNLITCTGDWNAQKKSRSERLIVFTDRESL